MHRHEHRRPSHAAIPPVKRKHITRHDPPEPDEIRETYSRTELLRMNDAFLEAMRRAIPAGLERCPIGVATAPCTNRPVVRS
jgi:hypothetical protein